MNICLLTPTFLPKIGGVENMVSSLAQWYTRAGHQVVVVTQWPRKGRGTPEDHRLDYPVIRYRRPMSFHWSIAMRGIDKALQQARAKVPFDVIHCHLAYPAGPLAISFGKKRKLPVIITTHGSDIRIDSRYRQRTMIWNRICRSIQQADAVTAISQDMMALLQQITGPTGPDIHLIPNAVDQADLTHPIQYDPAWPITKDEPFILYLGGLTHKKGVDVLLKAVDKLNDNAAFSTKLVIAGDGADRETLEKFARDHQLTHKVIFVGKVIGDFKRYLFQTCRFVVMPSLTEGFGLVAIEAFSCGKPLVASAVGGLQEMIGQHAELGLLVPPANADALADGVQSMTTNLDNFQVEPIQQFARQYDQTAITDAYLNLYRSVTTAPPQNA